MAATSQNNELAQFKALGLELRASDRLEQEVQREKIIPAIYTRRRVLFL